MPTKKKATTKKKTAHKVSHSRSSNPQVKRKVKKVMHEFKEGDLHSGRKNGPVVKSRKQAIAIALSEAGVSKKRRSVKKR